MSTELRDAIYTLLTDEIENKLSDYKPETTSMPFHTRLLGHRRIAEFSFVHSVNTSLGRWFERIAETVAQRNPRFSTVIPQYSGLGSSISTVAQNAIQAIIDDLGGKRVKSSATTVLSNKDAETAMILAVAQKGGMVPITCPLVDLFLESQDGSEYCFAMTTAKPNTGECKNHKRNLLEWIAIRGASRPQPTMRTMVAIPYNPHEPKPYSRWTLQRWFDVNSEILVGRDFWNFLGGDGTYEELLRVFAQAGLELDQEIRRRFERL